MKGQEFRARAKKVQKLGRDGLVEQNRATGEEKRISQRTADVSFAHERPPEQPAEGGTSRGVPVQGQRRSQPHPVRQQEPEPADTTDISVMSEPAEVAETASFRQMDNFSAPPPPPDRGGGNPPPAAPDTRAAVRKRQRAEFAAEKSDYTETTEDVLQESEPAPQHGRDDVPARPPGENGPLPSRLRFEAEPSQRQQSGKPKRRQLQFEDVPEPDTAADIGPSRHRQRQVINAQRRADKAEHSLEKVQANLPTKRRAHLEKQYDGESGKVRRRLRFENEVIPEGTPPPLPVRAGKGALRTAKTSAVWKVHGKVRETERENVAVEAAHKAEFAAERGAGRLIRWNQSRLRAQPYRAVRRAERRVVQENARLAWRTALRDTQGLQNKHALARWMQKRNLKRKYAKAAREAKKNVQRTRKVVSVAEEIGRAVVHLVTHSKIVLLVAGLILFIILIFSAGLSSCGAMFSSSQSTVLSMSYLASDADITNSDLYYTELETDLQIDINETETNYPDYDEYRCHIGEISHNPYELMAYLTVVYDEFTLDEVRGELDRLFGLQHTLTRETIVETRYDEEDEPYDWTILQTTLSVRSLSDVIAESLSAGEPAERYTLLMQTFGGRQEFGNPFDFPWLNYVSSDYGYRVHPISGVKNLHRGIDIAVAQGTPILTMQDGRVASAGEAGNYGLCIVIEHDGGYQSRYAHCSSLSVSAGQEVKRGDVIGAVGSTGNSTGPHLHLDVMLDGEYLNPYYFVDNGDGGSGTDSELSFPAYSGEPMGDGSFAAMLAEAEKYLGFPYVWGGSSPETSFDCSGYVSWVINQSGVGSVGRQTATGLYNLCTPVSRTNAKPGDLVFFARTYSTTSTITHVGIYVGNGKFIHCGDPISYASLDSTYWTEHFYAMGRLP